MNLIRAESSLIEALKKKGVACEADEYGMSITIDGVCFTINSEGNCGGDSFLEFDEYPEAKDQC